MIRLLPAIVIILAGCKGKEATDPAPEGATPSAPAPAVPADASTSTSTGAPVPRPAVDAAPEPLEVIENPMLFAERQRGQPTFDLPRCPRRGGPCVATFDFAYFVYKPGWRRHYVIDPGSPDSAVRQGNPSSAQLWRRINLAITAILDREGEKKGLLSCDLASRHHKLVGLKPWVQIDVAGKGAPLPDKLDGLVEVTPEQASRKVAEAWDALRGSTEAGREPMFSGATLAAMTGDALTNPRILQGMRWVGTDAGLQIGYYLVVSSPTSRRVFVRAGIDRGGDELLSHKALARRTRDDQARIRALIAQLDLKSIKVYARYLCDYPELTGYRDWIAIKR